MKLNAYILAADPAWIEASVLSYYDMVERIVVSFDAERRGWTGVPIDVEQCLRRLRAIDHAGKLDYRPGHFARSEYFGHPMENDTHQRQVALDQASEGADWVLQLDTDEILADSANFEAKLHEAEHAGRSALNYPAIYIWTRSRNGRYLEVTRRGWRRVPGYPGPVAVKPGETLKFSRRVQGGHYHVDLKWVASAGAVPNGISVDSVISATAAIYHLSWVRTDEWLERKLASWSHSRDRDWSEEVQRWRQARERPCWTALRSQFERGPRKKHLRLVRLPESVRQLVAVSDRNEFES